MASASLGVRVAVVARERCVSGGIEELEDPLLLGTLRLLGFLQALKVQLGVGDAKAYSSIRDMVADPRIDAIWLCGPNSARISNMEEIVAAVRDGGGKLRGLACEKPLARNVAEAKMVARLAKSAGLNTGYMENQLFAPDITRGKELIWARGAALTGRPYLARAAEEHSGPHMPWFWQGTQQGGGVLNDMMCHSVEVVRHLLTAPGAPRSSIKPVRITGHVASLKWSRPEYAKRLSAAMGKDVDYTKRPSEDFARATIEYEAESGERMVGEVTTSWSFVGAGLRLSAELLAGKRAEARSGPATVFLPAPRRPGRVGSPIR